MVEQMSDSKYLEQRTVLLARLDHVGRILMFSSPEQAARAATTTAEKSTAAKVAICLAARAAAKEKARMKVEEEAETTKSYYSKAGSAIADRLEFARAFAHALDVSICPILT